MPERRRWPELLRLLVSGTWARPLCSLVAPSDVVLWLLLACLVLLPVVMIQTLSWATVAQMEQQAEEIATLASGIRAYYADNVIGRLQAADGKAVYSEDYRNVHGGIPIPATLSIELGALFDNAHTDGRVTYKFISDFPFAKRVARPLDSFEREALETFRSDPTRKTVTQLQGNGLGRSAYRLATPVLMRQACVTCHNAHPDSPKRDWKVGDVRGIQKVTVRGQRVDGFGRLGLLLGYVALLGTVSLTASGVFRQQSRQLAKVNHKLLGANQRESAMAARMAEQLQELAIFASVVDHSIVGISVADMRQPDQPLIYVNKAFTVLTGYTSQLAVGYNCRFLQGPDTDPVEVRKIRQALSEGHSYTGDLINYRQDGSRFWNRLTLYPVAGVDGRPDFYVANQVDITALKEEVGVPLADLRGVESELEAAREALRQADRFGLALRQRLSRGSAEGGVSDLNNPLTRAGGVELEAFLLSERQAHKTVVAALDGMTALLARHTGP